jgi:hypothetical protein
MLEHVDEARMVRRRVSADDEDQVGAGQVFEFDGRGALADGCRQPLAGRLVAVVGAVVDVVGAEGAGQQLEDEAGLVRGAAGGIEEAAGGIGRLEPCGGMGDGPVPRDRRVALAAGSLVDRRVQTAEPLHLAARKLLQLGDGVREDLVRDRRLDVGRLRLHALVAH